MCAMDGIRESNRRNAGRKIKHTCACGRLIIGNGKAHQRWCEVHLRERGWPLANSMADAIRNEYPGSTSSDIIRHVERELGRIYLERRAAGDMSDLPWREYRDLVWRLAEEAGASEETS